MLENIPTRRIRVRLRANLKPAICYAMTQKFMRDIEGKTLEEMKTMYGHSHKCLEETRDGIIIILSISGVPLTSN